jgi:MFS family permease
MGPLLRRLPRQVWLIGLISLVNDGASDLIYPLLPLYLTQTLGAGPAALGLIEGIAEATASLLRLVSGTLSDRSHRRRPWIVAGYGLAGLSRPLIALAGSWPLVLVLRFSDRLGKGLRSAPRDALLAALVAPEQRGLAFGLHRALDNAGAVIGPLLAAALLALQLPLRSIIAWAWLPGLLCLLLALSLREPRWQESQANAPVGPPPREPGSPWLTPPPALRRYLLVVALFTLGNGSNLFLLLWARRLGVAEAQIPLLWAAISAVAMLGSAPLAAWSDRIGRRRLLVGGYLAYGLFYDAIGQLRTAGIWILPLFACYGLVLSATEGVERALVADLSPADQRGRAFGWFHLTTGLLLLPASWLFGWIYQSATPALAFSFAGSCALLAGLLMALVPLPQGRTLLG